MASAIAGSQPIIQPRIVRNDYGVLQPARLGEWSPRLPVSIVIPAFGGQEKLDLVLAALAAQTYPASLMEVVIADDGSDPPLRIPPIAPHGTRVLVTEPGNSGSSHALQTAVEATEGEVIHRIDSDMVLERNHVEALMRWHHLVDYVCAVGYKSFLDFQPGAVDPARVHQAIEHGEFDSLFDLEQGVASFTEKLIEETEQLRQAGARAYTVATGATLSFTRRTFREAGGMNTRLPLGGDTEFAYRVGQTGAVFIPDKEARSVHLGLPEVHRRGAEAARFRQPYVNNLVPMRRNWRKSAGRKWRVPYVDVAIEVGQSRLEDVTETVAGAHASTLRDVRVTLIGAWSALRGGHRPPLDDPRLDLRLIQETFCDDGRTEFAEELAETSFPAPFRFSCPVGWILQPKALERLTAMAEKEQYGALILALSDGGRLDTAKLERTAAVRRAARLVGPDEQLSEVVHETFGVHWMDGTEWALVARRKAPSPASRALAARPARAPQVKRRRWLHRRLWTIFRRKLARLLRRGAMLRDRLLARP